MFHQGCCLLARTVLTVAAVGVALIWAVPGSAHKKAETMTLAELPKGTTSFGAAVAGDWVYVYGGNCGAAHRYSTASQSNAFLRLSLKDQTQWEKLPSGPKLQGLAMVAHGGKLYRVGGFTARNEEGEPQDLWSTDEFARYDPAKGKWESLAPLPEPRSSHDAVVLGDQLYVVGGWMLQGESKRKWHKTAYVADLSQNKPTWKKLPSPPFQRRALTLGICDGKVYVIGGMQVQGGPTTKVAVFDPAEQSWSEGPSIHGSPMDGFGASAFILGKDLYVTTSSGKLQRLAPGSDKWEIVQTFRPGRFFHRMLPIDDRHLVLIGGTSRGRGRLKELQVLTVSPQRAAARDGS